MRARVVTRAAVGLSVLSILGCVGLQPAAAQFTSDHVSLRSHIDLPTFGAASGNDCWGYVSPSSREYAVMGLSNQVAFVEVTNPSAPVIVASVPHPASTWSDEKVFGHYAYVVNETGGGIQVIDLQNIDAGSVSLVATLPSPDTSHNVAIDTASGYLYTCGSRGGSATTVMFDLANPANPVQVGTWSGAYEHDAQIVTYTSGPNAGRQILFGSSEGRGLDIIDVTNKAGPFLISRTSYPNVAYCHQSWTEDLQYLYVDDELDSIPRTTVFDISDLANPLVVGEFGSGRGAIDHNLYVRNGFIYEANYHSGLRIFNANCDPTNPLQVGWFDSYPEDDSAGFDGAWSCYPFFPSGTVIVSDINRGLFVLDVSAALTAEAVLFNYPNGLPTLVAPAGGTRLRVEVTGVCGSVPAPNTGSFHYDTGGGFVSVPMEVISPNVYDAVFPAAPCRTQMTYYISVETANQAVLSDPPEAPAVTFSAVSANGISVIAGDDFETDQGWTAINLGAGSGDWQRGIPVDDPDWPYDPASDADGSGRCYLTQNQLGNTDVDNGAVQLVSPVFDLSQGGTIAYDYFLTLTNVSGGVDRLLVEISDNGGTGPWTEVARHITDGGLSWRHHEIDEAELVAAGVGLTSTMRLRFTANDADPQSIVEAGLDAFSVFKLLCCAGADGDMNGDSVTDGRDIEVFVAAALGVPNPSDLCHGDFNGDAILDTGDLPGLVAALLAP